MTDQRVAELRSVLESGGPGAAEAREALGGGPILGRLEAAILALAHHRGARSSTCPSDAARAVGGADWRDLVADAREIARRLARSGEVTITQRGATLDPDGEWRGPIRIRTAR
ncbi:DUF3253 domain-containing protein [Mycolicibacterium confluentis]|uniref:S-adenosylmethionine tRNA ribosyltransferase n=1 Tax=Mycolicibacterium confluentis TaxID=28047 RepID=A0A7I7XXA6_9MYCO|nr:DUF3253 domain-containing protein [Mycolicibacterium confluentis]BBZ33603.1 hypothetical protein MCNF_22080 [Mycolicibacterium confluentis]